MTEFNACFVSYRHPDDPTAKKFVQTFVKVLKKHLQWNLPNARIFFDEQGVQVGDMFNDKLAVQLCRSASLVICYGPRHFDSEHPYCTLEYLGMRELEKRRREQMREYLETNGLIFPVVFRGFESLPAEIANNRHCIKFDDVITETDFKSRNRLQKIDELARKIYERWEEMERSGVFINHDCSQFRFPEGEVAAWLNQHAKRSPARMPGR
jgi:hypothetical protein